MVKEIPDDNDTEGGCVLLHPDSQWVGAPPSISSPLLRKAFTLRAPRHAVLSICGLGFFEAYLNGRRIGEDRYVPAWTNYEPRENRRMLYPIHDAMRCRVTVMDYEVGSFLREGANVLAVWLGGGWYSQNRRNVEGDFAYGTPKLCFTLRWMDSDGEEHVVHSDRSMVWTGSEILESNIYYGETHDLRRRRRGFSLPEYDDTDWKPVQAAPAPRADLTPSSAPPDRVIRTLAPVLIWKAGNRRIYDCGENIAGVAVLRLPADPGRETTVVHSENLAPDGESLNPASTGGGGQIQADRYIAGEREETVWPRFVWHGFRYVEVIGPGEVERVEVIHADVAIASSFSCSNETLNWLYHAYLRTQLANLHSGVPSDCPHRERLGYTGDGQVTAPAAMLTLDIRSLYSKWMQDIADGQDPITGHVQHTAPFYGGGGGPGGWGGAIFKIPMAYYRQYGDAEFLRRYYPHMRLWLDYMESRSKDGLVIAEEEGGWCLGDWCTPDPPELPEAFVNTYYYILGIREVLFAAGTLGIAEDTAALILREKRCRAALCRAFLDERTGSFCGGVNGADAFALDIGLGGEDTKTALRNRYRAADTLDTGIFGTDVLIDWLFELGAGADAVRLLEASFRPMRENGATTLWETWNDPVMSNSHPMFGGVVRTLFTRVLGIRQRGVGYAEVTAVPAVIPGLAWAAGHITAPDGRIIRAEVRRAADGTPQVVLRQTAD